MCVHVSQPRWNPPKRPMGSEHHLLWGGGPSLSDLQGAFLCTHTQGGPLTPRMRKIGGLLSRVTWTARWSNQVSPKGNQFSCSVVSFSVTPWTAAHQVSLSITNSRSVLKFMSIESVMPSKHLILCRPLLLLPSVFPSIRVFSNESVLCIRWPRYWSFSFSIRSSNEYSGLISFRMDRLNLLAVQGTLKSLLQHHSSKASILQRSTVFIVQLSHQYMITGKSTLNIHWKY